MNDTEKQEKNFCCAVHSMYDTVLCENPKDHVGLHKGFYQGEFLRWGVPSYEEMYDIKRTKE